MPFLLFAVNPLTTRVVVGSVWTVLRANTWQTRVAPHISSKAGVLSSGSPRSQHTHAWLSRREFSRFIAVLFPLSHPSPKYALGVHGLKVFSKPRQLNSIPINMSIFILHSLPKLNKDSSYQRWTHRLDGALATQWTVATVSGFKWNFFSSMQNLSTAYWYLNATLYFPPDCTQEKAVLHLFAIHSEWFVNSCTGRLDCTALLKNRFLP